MERTTQTHRKDRGWSWLVAIGAFTSMLLETGILKSLGVLLPSLSKHFCMDVWAIGLAISLVPGFGTVSCPIAGALSKRFSSRIIMMTFGLLSSAGLVIGSFAQSIPVLSVSLLFTGFAIGAETITIASLSEYFDTYFDIADAAAHAGVSFGVIIMPLLTQFLFDIYGWRGTLLILGAVNMHLVVSGATLIPYCSNQTEEQDEEDIHRGSTGKVSDQRKYTMSPDRTEERLYKSVMERSLYAVINNLDLSLFTNVNFLSLVCISTASGYYYTGWIIYLIPHGINLGYKPYQAAFLSTVGGIGHLLGTISFPFLTRILSGKTIVYISTIMASASLAMDPLCSLFSFYVGQLLMSGVFGFSRAMISCAVFKVAVGVDLKDRISNVVSWIFVGYGLGSIASGYFSGWLYDVTGSYSTSFLILSIVALLAMAPQVLIDFNNYRVHRYSSIATTESDSE